MAECEENYNLDLRSRGLNYSKCTMYFLGFGNSLDAVSSKRINF